MDICNRDLCTGCQACLNICQHNAIEFYADEMGYYYPKIDPSLCVNCGICARKCPANSSVELHHPVKVLAAKTIDSFLLKASSSGGISSLLCRNAIFEGGVAYGCISPNYREVFHTRADLIDQTIPMQGSKYVQSQIGYIFRDIKENLQKGKKVVFTGVPCQVAGLKLFLGKSYDNLLTIDLVCHGVSSQKLLNENVQDVFLKYNKPLSNIQLRFRSKFEGPKDSINVKYGLWFENGNEQNAGIPLYESALPNNNYITSYIAGLIFRESCYACQYTQVNRTGDITLGDFWGLTPLSSIVKSDGVNLVLINTEKGWEAFSKIKSHIEFEERSLEEAVKGNLRLSYPSKRPKERDSFFRDYRNGHEEAYNKALKAYRTSYKYRQIKLIFINKLRESKLLLGIYYWLKYKVLNNGI